jgi:hypothetical protein
MIGSYEAGRRGHREVEVDFDSPHPGVPGGAGGSSGSGAHYPRPGWVPPVWPTDVISSGQVSVRLTVEKRDCHTYAFPVRRR